MNRYEERINLYGTSNREREKNMYKQSLALKSESSLSCKDVLINGIEDKLIINTGTQPYYKTYCTLPDKSINIGDYVDFANQKWLVTTADSDNELYIDGKLEQCNWLLKWQNLNGEIIERWAVVSSASKYNDGETGNATITLGSDQLSVQIPIDSESLSIKRNIKFFIDNNTTEPTTYELTGTNNVTATYNGHGVTSWIVKECAYSPTEEDLEHGVCDYISPTTPVEPEEDTWNMTMTWTGSDIIRIGGSDKVLTAQLIDSDGENVDDCTYLWVVESDYEDFENYVTWESDENVLTISASDELEENITVTIRAASQYTGQAFEHEFSVEMGV